MGVTWDVVRLTPGGVEAFHWQGPIRTDGPFLFLTDESNTYPIHVVPAHALASMDICGEHGACKVSAAADRDGT